MIAIAMLFLSMKNHPDKEEAIIKQVDNGANEGNIFYCIGSLTPCIPLIFSATWTMYMLN